MRRLTVRSGLVVLLTGFVLVFCRTVRAQTTGDIEGKITDFSGVALPGVTVEARSPSLQGVRTGLTNRDGVYWFPGVPPGIYSIQANLPGFDPAGKTVRVALDATATVDLKLRMSVRESVLVDVTSTTGGASYTTKVISKLPVARNYADIVRSNPGVFVDRGDTQGRSLALAIYGATSVENQWIIDGINTTNVIRGFQGKAINNEFVQEVEVKTGGYQAEYGRALGGVINVITKSGGNEFHGDAFVYYDSQETRADEVITDRDSLVGRMRVSDYRRTDFGLDLGGYVFADRLWFFAAYNRIDLPAKVSRYESSELVPSNLQFPLNGTDNLYSGKLTWNAATGTTLVATVFADPTTNSGAGGSDPRQQQRAIRLINNPDPATWDSSRTIGGTDYGLRLNQLFGSTGLLTAQGSRHNESFELTTSGEGAVPRLDDLTCVGGTPTEPCRAAPVLAPNFSSGGFGRVLGFFNRNFSHRNRYSVDAALYLGSHEVKAGGDHQDATTHAVDYFTGGQRVRRYNERGQTYYQHSFFAVSPTDRTPLDESVTEGGTRELGAYLQDTWRIASGWTINAGLRWDEERILDYNRDAILVTTNEWQPRLGVVWDPKRDGRTKVYAFVGRFYYSLPTDLVVRSFGNQTTVRTYNFDPVNLVHDPAVLRHADPDISGGAFATPVDDNLKGDYQDELTIGIEKLMTPTFSVSLKATYRRLGSIIEDRCDLDPNRPETSYSFCGIYNVGSSGPIAHGDLPSCSGLHGDLPEDYPCTETGLPTPPVRRLYRGIEILGRKSLSESLWLQASYLYSSLRGNYDGGVSQGLGGQTDPGINFDFDYPEMHHDIYGRLYLDRPHSFRFDGYYVTPLKVFVGLQGYVQSGAPESRLGYLNEFSPGAVFLVPRGTEGRLPTVWEANLTLGYPFRVGPATVTVQAFVFNLFDNQIATTRDDTWSDSPPPDYPTSLYDPDQGQNNPEYGKTTSRQEPRSVRAALKISF
jgi:outer membrane receptor protein involved in Fe transport